MVVTHRLLYIPCLTSAVIFQIEPIVFHPFNHCSVSVCLSSSSWSDILTSGICKREVRNSVGYRIPLFIIVCSPRVFLDGKCCCFFKPSLFILSLFSRDLSISTHHLTHDKE